MHRDHDQRSGMLAPQSEGIGAPGTDPLSDVLRMVRLTGAVFFLVDASPPWVIEAPDGETLAPAVLPRTQHVISYHVVTSGSCWGALSAGEPVELSASDVVVFPRGDPYVLSLARGARGGPDRSEVLEFLRLMAASQLPFSITEGGGGKERLQLVCGFLGCDFRPFNPLLSTLPRLLHLPRAVSSSSGSLRQLIELTLAESSRTSSGGAGGAGGAGGECVRLRLSELIFVEVVRRYLETLPPSETSWLAGLRDPVVGRALALLHEFPARSWTLPVLAREVGTSRSVLADRFTHFVGQPPMHYLTCWRMQVAARFLADGAARVSTVAFEVGYDSEAAFSRAFKKVAGVTPSAWRRSATDRASDSR